MDTGDMVPQQRRRRSARYETQQQAQPEPNVMEGEVPVPRAILRARQAAAAEAATQPPAGADDPNAPIVRSNLRRRNALLSHSIPEPPMPPAQETHAPQAQGNHIEQPPPGTYQSAGLAHPQEQPVSAQKPAQAEEQQPRTSMYEQLGLTGAAYQNTSPHAPTQRRYRHTQSIPAVHHGTYQMTGPQHAHPGAYQATGPQQAHPGAYQATGPQQAHPGAYQATGPQQVQPGAYQMTGPQQTHPGAYQMTNPQQATMTMPRRAPYAPGMQPGPQAGMQYPPQGMPPIAPAAGVSAYGQGGQPPIPPQMGPAQEQEPQPPFRRQRSGGLPPMAKKVLLILLAAALVIGAVVGLSALKRQRDLESYVSAYNDRYCQGVYVNGVNLGGMTQAEAQQAVVSQAQQHNDWSIRLTYQGQLVTEINAGQLGISVHGMTDEMLAALRDAWYMGHTGTLEERRTVMEELLVSNYHGYSDPPASDTSVIDSILNDLRNRVYRAPQDAAIAGFNPENTDPFTFTEPVMGRDLDIGPIRERIFHMLSTMESGEIEIEPMALEPSVTVADLRRMVTLRASAYTEISTTSEEGRNNNIRRAFEKITGTVLAPGDTFSFNGTVGERSVANGFFPAPEYVYDQLTTGIGGGVCQASTTLFQAAVKAGLRITAHTPHSERANYADYGMDATVAWASNHRIDMKFVNNTLGNIYIVCSVQSNPNNRKRLIAKVDIYGMDMEGVTYGFRSELMEELPYTTKIVRDKKHQYVTYVDEVYQYQKGRTGYVYQSYRDMYLNGVLVETVAMFTDTYKAREEIIYEGTLERPEEEPEVPE